MIATKRVVAEHVNEVKRGHHPSQTTPKLRRQPLPLILTWAESMSKSEIRIRFPALKDQLKDQLKDLHVELALGELALNEEDGCGPILVKGTLSVAHKGKPKWQTPTFGGGYLSFLVAFKKSRRHFGA